MTGPKRQDGTVLDGRASLLVTELKFLAPIKSIPPEVKVCTLVFYKNDKLAAKSCILI